MHLEQLSLLQYKNFSEAQFEFDSHINCLVGRNGAGKTNVLDAIYHLAFGRSYFNPVAVQNIRHGDDFFVVEGRFDKSQREEFIVCSLRKGQKKILKRNGKAYDKFSEHLGLIPMVILSPYDRDLISEGSETRRNFLDSVISQLDGTYLQQLISYQKVLSQRNALLKYFAANRIFETDTLEIYDEQLEVLGQPIFETRRRFVDDFTPIFHDFYEKIAPSTDAVSLKYDSHLQTNGTLHLLRENLSRDRQVQYTTTGVHKDDLLFEIDGHPIKKFGSQGQQKSYLIALKLAQFEFVSRKSGEKPILLFDDIFDKLDASRVEKIVEMVNQGVFGQIFISDTHSDRTEALVKETGLSYKLFRLE